MCDVISLKYVIIDPANVTKYGRKWLVYTTSIRWYNNSKKFIRFIRHNELILQWAVNEFINVVLFEGSRFHPIAHLSRRTNAVEENWNSNPTYYKPFHFTSSLSRWRESSRCYSQTIWIIGLNYILSFKKNWRVAFQMLFLFVKK